LRAYEISSKKCCQYHLKTQREVTFLAPMSVFLVIQVFFFLCMKLCTWCLESLEMFGTGRPMSSVTFQQPFIIHMKG